MEPEYEISVAKCDQDIPDWTSIDPRLTPGECSGFRWSVTINGGRAWECCDTLGDIDFLLVPITGYTRNEFLALAGLKEV